MVVVTAMPVKTGSQEKQLTLNFMECMIKLVFSAASEKSHLWKNLEATMVHCVDTNL